MSYREVHSTFEDNGKLFDLNLIFRITENKEVKRMKVSRLSWVLKDINLDNMRINNADLSFPIIVWYYNNKWVVVDGAHRLAKAVSLHKQLINVVTISTEEMKRAYIGKSDET